MPPITEIKREIKDMERTKEEGNLYKEYEP